MSTTTDSAQENPPISSERAKRGRATGIGSGGLPIQRSDIGLLETVDSDRVAFPAFGPETLRPNIRIHQYELIRELGRGAMGTVFLARDTRLGRLVAIKFLNGHTAFSAQRFIEEARTTAQCTHDNIVVIHEINEFQAQPYMVLEYLEGRALARLIQDRRIPASRTVELIVPVVRALKRAHDFGIVHRDLKPDNIFVTDAGTVKVLDFGIARPLTDSFGSLPERHGSDDLDDRDLRRSLTIRDGKLAGTMPYMSPEQWGADTVDFRTDLWAVGMIMFEMLLGRHPLEPFETDRLEAIADLEQPMPRLQSLVPETPTELARIVDRCLSKPKDGRFASAAELLQALEPLLPGRYHASLRGDEIPYTGLAAFQESDADRFFGRERDVARMKVRVREHALVGVVGPSGVGKSSFIRAGLIPALKRSAEDWEVMITRPGRNPLSGLASLLVPLLESVANPDAEEHQELIARLREEPGYLGQFLRSRAIAAKKRLLVFVDQFEELYTLVADADERRAFLACLEGVADHSSSPLRVAISMRSDFLDRAAEDRSLIDGLTPGLIFLAPPDRDGLRAALTMPAEMAGYRFDPPELVEDILDTLEATSGALPLLQFAASKLWEARDRQEKRITAAIYTELGGIAGALASHADSVLAGLPATAQRLVRAMFLRLVTPERTRSLVDMSELRQLDEDTGQMQRLIDHLISARLLVAQTGLGGHDDEDATVEIVHESLIDNWPTLNRWLEQHHDDVAFLNQLRGAANQWHNTGKPQGLLWRGEAVEEARRFRSRFQGELSAKEHQYLHAVLELADRSRRIKRRVIAGTILFLTALVAAAAIALVLIRTAEKQARREAERARAAEAKARDAENRAVEAATTARENQRVAEQRLAETVAARAARDVAQKQASDATAVAEEKTAEAAKSRAELIERNLQLEEALEAARIKSERAQASEKAALLANAKLEKANKALDETRSRLEIQLARERERNRKKSKELKGLGTEKLR